MATSHHKVKLMPGCVTDHKMSTMRTLGVDVRNRETQESENCEESESELTTERQGPKFQGKQNHPFIGVILVS